MSQSVKTGSSPAEPSTRRASQTNAPASARTAPTASLPADKVTLAAHDGAPAPTLQGALSQVAALAKAASAHRRVTDAGDADNAAAGLAALDAAIEASKVDLDPDHDGMLSDQEAVIGTDPTDSDSDDDGIPDFVDGFADSDGDGAPDALDPDSDDDGTFDGTESGVTVAGEGTDSSKGHFVPDLDPGKTSNPVLADSDGDGLRDGEEDLDRDGVTDNGESDPTRSDSDRDGVDDEREGALWFRILSWWRSRE
ncbi:MAG: hypothetical protein RL199_1694 [Pseudomonadota bacterium]|jgi:hypothetical protein